MNPTRLITPLRLCALASLLLGAGTARACTTFVLQSANHLYFGRSLDWVSEEALVIVNPRHAQKSSLVAPGTTPAKWVSKYGSLTFNSGGWEMPTGGMNEAGLVVENMWLIETRPPEPDARPVLNSLQWIQYQLDSCRTVDEVIATDSKIRLDTADPRIPLHYLVCDASGDCAVIEFLDGKMVCHRGGHLPCRALANDSYDEAVAAAKPLPATGDSEAKPAVSPRFRRFAVAAQRAAAFHSGTARENLDYAFATLDMVSKDDTVWRMVYDIKERQIYYRTRSHPAERALDLNGMDFACHGQVRFFDLSSSSRPEPPVFEELTEAKHRQYLERYLAQDRVKRIFGDVQPFMEGLLLNLRAYHCAEPPAPAGTPRATEQAGRVQSPL
jgi:choloylglycine hydrolase